MPLPRILSIDELSCIDMLRTLALLRNASLLISALSMAAAFVVGGHWIIVAVLLAQVGFWFALPRHSVQWRSACLLVAYVALAIAGVLLGLTVSLLLVGTAAALAAWDLLNFGETLKDVSGAETIKLLSRSHLRSLFLALSLGALLSATALAVDLSLPFPVVGLLALTFVVSLVRAAEHLRGING